MGAFGTRGAWAVAILAIAIGSQARAEGDGDDGRARFFEREVRPLLIAKCQQCHGPKKHKGGLRLDSRAAFEAGGESGPVVEPGKLDESPLIEAVRYEGLEMPPDDRLADDQVAILERWVVEGAVWPGAAGPVVAKAEEAVDEPLWSTIPPADVRPPSLEGLAGTAWEGWARNPVDAFVLAELVRNKLAPAPEASRRELIRRATFDLTGLPPTPAEVAAFLADESIDAYERLIDRLLASPAYGDRWGRHWLDVVRYAESDGHNADAYRPQAWRYRDYVVASFNADKPYDRFTAEQIAGDELAPGDPDATVATGFLRLGPYEYNQRDVRGQWSNILDETTDVVGEAFLGLSVACARCHDHKFDPIPQTDYFRLRAFFAPVLPRDDLPLCTVAEQNDHDARLAAWNDATKDLRAEIDAIEKPYREYREHDAVIKFTADVQELLATPDADLPPYDRQIKALAYRQIVFSRDAVLTAGAIKKADRDRWQALTDELKKRAATRPAALPEALGVRDVGPEAPPTIIERSRKANGPIEPGFPTAVEPSPPEIRPTATSTGRRLALASWLNEPDNPLTSRVIVNRVWQYHFGRGIVATANDFGRMGDPPSHPELLDWLARRFVADGRRFKALHRLLVTSSAYRQSAFRPESEAEEARSIDPDDRLLWKRPVRRLEAEAIRDAMLAVSGELLPARGGPAVDAATTPRRSVDCKVVRNFRAPVLDAFDFPDGFNSTGARNTTTAVTQTLLLINGPWTLKRAGALAARLEREAGDDDRARVALAFRLAFAREPENDEIDEAVAFLRRGDRREALVDYCHVLLNSSEFLYLD